MKHTVELAQGRKAVVEIPYNKLTANSTAYRQTHNGHACDSKLVMLDCGNGCSNHRRSTNEIQLIIADLEDSYEKEVTEMTARILQLEKESRDSKQAQSA